MSISTPKEKKTTWKNLEGIRTGTIYVTISPDSQSIEIHSVVRNVQEHVTKPHCPSEENLRRLHRRKSDGQGLNA